MVGGTTCVRNLHVDRVHVHHASWILLEQILNIRKEEHHFEHLSVVVTTYNNYIAGWTCMRLIRLASAGKGLHSDSNSLASAQSGLQ